LNADRWAENADYFFGIDLFNHGYLLEAHESLEGLWHACGRSGIIGDMLKGLIQLTAAASRFARSPRGVPDWRGGGKHCFSASVRRSAPLGQFLGLDVEQLQSFAVELATHPSAIPAPPTIPSKRYCPLSSCPKEEKREPARTTPGLVASCLCGRVLLAVVLYSCPSTP